MEYLDLGDFLHIAARTLNLNEAAIGRLAHPGLTTSALDCPHARYGDYEFYSRVEEKAAALLDGILRHRPLVDGNKRVAFMCTLQFLGMNCLDLHLESDDEAFEMLVAAEARSLPLDKLAEWMAARLAPAEDGVNWPVLTVVEPGLNRLEKEALALRDAEVFCNTGVWYRVLKPVLVHLIGWGRGHGITPPAEMMGEEREVRFLSWAERREEEGPDPEPLDTPVERLLRSTDAYDVAYEHLYELLPDCRGCWHTSPAYNQDYEPPDSSEWSEPY